MSLQIYYSSAEDVADLKEAGDSSSSTLVSVHPSHKTASLDVGSTSVVGDALETPHKNQPPLIKDSDTDTEQFLQMFSVHERQFHACISPYMALNLNVF